MFAARALDPTLHGGFVAFGEPTVLIGGLPAARVSDPHVCSLNPPLLPHVGGWVAGGSLTVLIGGQGAARQGDLCACCVAPVSLPSAPAASPASGETPDAPERERGSVELGYSDRKDLDLNGDGVAETHKREAAGVQSEQHDELFGFIRHESIKKALYHETEYTTKQLDGTDHELIVGGKQEGGALKQTDTYVIGDDANPFIEVEKKHKVLSAEASAVEPLIGTDGRRYGFGAEVGSKGSVVSHALKVESDVAVMPLLTPIALAARKYAGLNADMMGSASISGGSAGIVGGGWLYYEEGRINWSLKGKVGILGVGVSFEIGATAGVMNDRSLLDYFREEPSTIDPALVEELVERAKATLATQLLALVPNSIAMGCPTVMIGG
jgi:uncharacterized Zn-binding protein involved in type VI secretion